MESLKNELTATYYQKQYQASYDQDEEFSWDSIIPECPAEMTGALRFCKQHIDDENAAISTLHRLVETCEMDYTDAPEVQKILPSIRQILKKNDEEEKKNANERARREAIKKKVNLIMWIFVLILIILQVIFWGWWTILSGAATLVFVGFIYFIIDDCLL